MLQQAVNLFTSAFYFQGLEWTEALVAIALAFGFGAIWLAPYLPPVLRNRKLWLVFIGSALVTWFSIAFIQSPLQTLVGRGLVAVFSSESLNRWLLLAGIPQILLSGFVQEAAKLAPLFFYRYRNKGGFMPKHGLIAGAISGAGFGIFEAVWVHSSMFAGGWDWYMVRLYGFTGLLGLFERFFTIALHIAVSALAGYGLAKGKGWQFYIIASLLHSFANYGVLLLQKGVLTPMQTEIYIAGVASAVTAAALYIRWRRNPDTQSG